MTTVQKFDKCIFQNYLTTCDKRQPFGCICTKHMRLIFGMDCVEDIVTTKRFTKTITKQVFTSVSNSIVLPFPFQIDENGKFCLLRNEANDIISQYVGQLSLPDDATGTARKRISAIIFSLFMSGLFVTENTGVTCGLFADYVKLSSSYYDNKFEHCKIDIYGLGDNRMQGTFRDFPIIYRILLQFAEFSTIERDASRRNNTNDAAAMRTFTPNLILDLERHAFVIVNDINNETVTFQTDRATFASPVILSGKRTSSTLDAFTSSQFINMTAIEMVPNLCPSANKTISLIRLH